VKAAKAAVEPLKLEPLAAGDWIIFAEIRRPHRIENVVDAVH